METFGWKIPHTYASWSWRECLHSNSAFIVAPVVTVAVVVVVVVMVAGG